MIGRKFPKIVSLFLLFVGCGLQLQRNMYPPQKINEMPYDVIKVHMKNGELYILDHWRVDENNKILKGIGRHYGLHRELLKKDSFNIPIDSIALIESNKIYSDIYHIHLLPLILMTGASIAVTLYCLENPKACFGSCPTFYVSNQLKAEGFSSSIAPSLEADDIDLLLNVKPENGELSIEMRNEALETHVVRYANILAVPKENDKYIFATSDGEFYQVGKLISPLSVKCSQKDCFDLISKLDEREYFSLADEKNLLESEEIELTFVAEKDKNYGLVVGTRQSLLLTFIFYQMLAYMGSNAGYFLSRIGNINAEKYKKLEKVIKKIKGLEIYVKKNKGWDRVGYAEGEGPIAIDYSLINIGKLNEDTVKIKIYMTKGALRLDYVALAEIDKPAKPITIEPYLVLYNNEENKGALEALLDKNKVLTTLPGDAYVLKYKIPEGDFEFFLNARGYYLEWIRKEWLKEENLNLFMEFVFFPEIALRRLAPKFKKIEGQMEHIFWRSKYVKQKQ